MIVDKKTGDILCIYAFGQGLWQSTASDPIRIGLSRSKDNGKTWTPTEDITSQIYGAECKDLYAVTGTELLPLPDEAYN